MNANNKKATTMINLHAEIIANPEKRDALQIALQHLLEPTRQEEGCCQYELYQDTQAPDRFLMQEVWCSQASLDAHQKSPHLEAFRQLITRNNLVKQSTLSYLRFIG